MSKDWPTISHVILVAGIITTDTLDILTGIAKNLIQ